MMATKDDFSKEEWEALRKGLVGAGMLVSLSDRDFTDSFGEAGAMAKYLAGQQTAARTELARELAKGSGRPFGLTASAERVRTETMDALSSSVATLGTKDPAELGAYRELVLGLAETVANAKGGEVPVEAEMIARIREALGATEGDA
jgi:hypothetical protein